MKTWNSLFSLIVGFVTALSATGQTSLPLRFVPADSVFTWAYAGQGFPMIAQSLCPGVRAAELAVPSGAADYRQKVEKLWQQVQPELNVVGGGDDELSYGQGLPAAYGFNLNGLMLLLTGRAAHADMMERSLFNAVMRTLADSTLARRPDDLRAVAETLMGVPGVVYATTADERDLYVNLYTNATANLCLQHERFALDQITDMPWSGQVKFRVSRLARPLPLRVHLRLPDWACKRRLPLTAFAYADTTACLPRVYVNGHEIEPLKADADGYVVIERTWRSLDEIYIDFPLVPQYVRRAEAATGATRRGALALQLGPVVYMVTTPTEGCGFVAHDALRLSPHPAPSGRQQVEGDMFRYAGTPQDAAAPRVPFLAVPYADGAPGRVWLSETE